METETCSDCKYYEESNETCYLMPPVWLIDPAYWGRPEVEKNDFCSKWEAIPEE